MSDRENSEKRDEDAKETDTRTESTSMEETEGKDMDLRKSEADDRTDRKHEREPRSSAEKKDNATQMRYGMGQLSENRRTGVADCRYYLKNGRCGLGRRCRFNHPLMRDDMVQPSHYPVRPESSQMMQRHGMVQPSPYPVRPLSSQMMQRHDMVQYPARPESSQMIRRHDMVQPSSYPVRPESSQMIRRHDMVQPSQYPLRPESSQMMRRHDMAQPSPYPGEEDCRQYLQNGKCSYGPKCRFNHRPVLPQNVSRQSCKYFQKGSCTFGSDCKFTHSMREDGAEPMRQDTTWGKKFHEKRHGAKSRSRAWKRERQGHDLEEQKQKKRKVENLRIGPPTVQSGEGGTQTEQRLEIPENLNVNAQENPQEQAEMEMQNREAQEKAQEERRLQIDNERRQARLRLEQMRPRVLTGNVDQLRKLLADIGIDRKEGDGF